MKSDFETAWIGTLPALALCRRDYSVAVEYDSSLDILAVKARVRRNNACDMKDVAGSRLAVPGHLSISNQ